MNRVFSVLAFFIICFCVYGFYLSQYEFSLFSEKNQKSSLFYDYRLVQNIHTVYSQGSGTVGSIAEEARSAKIDFLLFTDVNFTNFVEKDRYFNRVGLLFSNKVVSEDIRKYTYSTTSETTADLSLNVMAHPLRRDFNFFEAYGKENFDGFEVINLKSISQLSWSKSKLSTLWSLLFYPFNPRLSLMRLFIEPDDELYFYDQYNLHKKAVMYLGTEASARAIPITNLLMKFPSYERSFTIGSQHLLLSSELSGNIEKDRLSLLTALKRGQFYISFDELGDPTGFEVYVSQNSQKKHFLMGDTFSYQKNQHLIYNLPAEPNIFFEVVLFKNGKRIDHFNTKAGSFEIKGPGQYRLQVRLSPSLPMPDATKWLTWIYTNSFYVTN